MFLALLEKAIVDLAIAAAVFVAVYIAFGRRLWTGAALRATLGERHLITDLGHWFGNRVIFGPLWMVTIAFIFVPPWQEGAHKPGIAELIEMLPAFAQILLALFLFDLAAYWRHRLTHASFLWSIHAVHHSATRLNWLTGVRNHPLDQLLIYLSGAVIFAYAGFPMEIVTVTGMIRFYWVCFIHTDLRLDLGPLNYVITTPDFHRWHHVPDGVRHTNFAGFFSFIDLAFGTFHLPKDRRATEFGIDEPCYPTGYVGQLIAPLRALLAVLRGSVRRPAV